MIAQWQCDHLHLYLCIDKSVKRASLFEFWVICIIIKAKKQHWAWDTPCYLKWLLGNVQLHSKKPFWSNLHKNKNQATLLIVDLSQKCQQI